MELPREDEPNEPLIEPIRTPSEEIHLRTVTPTLSLDEAHCSRTTRATTPSGAPVTLTDDNTAKQATASAHVAPAPAPAP